MTKYNFDSDGHFYSSSIAEWETNKDAGKLITSMRRRGFSFSLWYVPLDEDADYEIEQYRPQVKGAVWLGNYNRKGKPCDR